MKTKISRLPPAALVVALIFFAGESWAQRTPTRTTTSSDGVRTMGTRSTESSRSSDDDDEKKTKRSKSSKETRNKRTGNSTKSTRSQSSTSRGTAGQTSRSPSQTRPKATRTSTKTKATRTSTTGKHTRTKPSRTSTTGTRPSQPTPRPVQKENNIYPYGLGLKVGLMPYNVMTADLKGCGEAEFNMRMGYGFGVEGQYRLANWFYLTAELMYWFLEIEEVGGQSYNARESDGMLNIGAGIKSCFLGNDLTSNQLYARGTIGYSGYFSNDSNASPGNRGGLYYGFGVGAQHNMSRRFRLFAESGLYWSNFTSVSNGEDETRFFNWQATAGFLVHWR